MWGRLFFLDLHSHIIIAAEQQIDRHSTEQIKQFPMLGIGKNRLHIFFADFALHDRRKTL